MINIGIRARARTRDFLGFFSRFVLKCFTNDHFFTINISLASFKFNCFFLLEDWLEWNLWYPLFINWLMNLLCHRKLLDFISQRRYRLDNALLLYYFLRNFIEESLTISVRSGWNRRTTRFITIIILSLWVLCCLDACSLYHTVL